MISSQFEKLQDVERLMHEGNLDEALSEVKNFEKKKGLKNDEQLKFWK